MTEFGKKRGVSNTALRAHFVPAGAQSESRSGGGRGALIFLAILIPAALVFAWRGGYLPRSLNFKGLTASRAATATQPEAPALRPAASAEPIAHKASDSERSELFDFLQKEVSEIRASVVQSQQSGSASAGRKPLETECAMTVATRSAGRQKMSDIDDSLFLIDMVGDRVACMMSRDPARLCDAATRGALVERTALYLRVHASALANKPELATRLKNGAFAEVSKQIRHLAARRVLGPRDFSDVAAASFAALTRGVTVQAPLCTDASKQK